MKKPVSVSLVTLGCPKNIADSENLIKMLAAEGFFCVEEPEGADILLVNTCGFIKDAKQESVDEILRATLLKKDGERLVVFGCLAKRYRDELLREIPEIDAIFGVGEEDNILAYCKSAGVKKTVRQKKSKDASGGKIDSRQNRAPELQDSRASYAYLKIAEGCDNRCSYCVIPSIRGRYRSISPDDILENAGRLIGMGIKELILVAQDTAAYGRDLKGYRLESLIRDISSINGDFWIRLLYMYPTSLDDTMLRTIAEVEKVCKYLDMPLQHSEDRILKLMGRRGSREAYISLIKRIRGIMPGIALRTTFITGFPSETEEEHRGLRDFICGVEFDRLGIFKYSKEEGTPAFKIKGQLPEEIKNRRFDELMRLQSEISLRKNKRLVGKTFRVLVDESDSLIAVARLSSQAPDIDGVTFVEGDKLKKGDFADVIIKDAYDYDLKGITA